LAKEGGGENENMVCAPPTGGGIRVRGSPAPNGDPGHAKGGQMATSRDGKGLEKTRCRQAKGAQPSGGPQSGVGKETSPGVPGDMSFLGGKGGKKLQRGAPTASVFTDVRTATFS